MFSKELEQINVKKADVTQEKKVLVGKPIFWEFQKQEKIFLKEFKQMQTEKIETVKEKEVLSGSPIF